MVDEHAEETPAETSLDIKERRCLKCRVRFTSSWAGERVCPKCKSRATWHTGSDWLPDAF